MCVQLSACDQYTVGALKLSLRATLDMGRDQGQESPVGLRNQELIVRQVRKMETWLAVSSGSVSVTLLPSEEL